MIDSCLVMRVRSGRNCCGVTSSLFSQRVSTKAQGLIDTQMIKVDRAVEIDPGLFRGADLLKERQQLLRGNLHAVIEDRLGRRPALGFIAKRLLAGVGDL